MTIASSKRALLRGVTLVLAATMLLGVASAQILPTQAEDSIETRPAIEEPESREAVRELVSRMSDDAVRAILIEQLDALADARQAAAKDTGALVVLAGAFGNYWQNAVHSVLNLNSVPDIVSSLASVVGESLQPAGSARLLLVIVAAISLGLVSERAVALFFKRRKQALIEAYSTTLLGILRIVYTRLSFDLLGVAAFALAGYVLITSYYDKDTLGMQSAYTAMIAIAAGWLAYVVSRFYFAPRRPDLRICKTSDEKAMRLTVSYSLLAAYIVLLHNVFYLLLLATKDLGGFEFMAPLGFVMNLSMYIAASGIIWYNSEGLTEVLTENKRRVYLAIGEQAPDDLSWFAVNWPVIAVVLVLLKYFLVEIVINTTDVGTYSTAAVYITFIVIFLWPGVDANISLWVAKGIRTPEDESDAAGKARRTMQQGLLRVGRVLVLGLVLYLLAWLWGVNVLDLAEAGLGAQAAGNLIELLFIALWAYMAWELVTIFVGRWLAAEGGDPNDQDDDPGSGDMGGVGLSRVATLLPIVRKSAQFLIVVVSIIMVLNNWGFNIGPILAGAGVVGLAIGFGAQTLVKDIVSGLFFLADDAFRVGEYIDVGGTMGTVEKISLRSLRLRHHRGLVHTIPYGEIPKLTNFSRDWVIMKLRFRVPFETDINKVKKIFKKIGNDLLEDPVLGEDFLQPFKSQGVAEVDDNGIVVRGKFMAKPGKQFMIRKEVYVRVQKAFDEAGIPFARKQVMVHIPGLEKSDDMDGEDIKAIAAAASEAAEDDDARAPDKKKTQ